ALAPKTTDEEHDQPGAPSLPAFAGNDAMIANLHASHGNAFVGALLGGQATEPEPQPAPDVSSWPPEQAQATASDTTTAPATLDALSRYPDDGVQLSVARNTSTPRKTLYRMAESTSSAMRLALLENESSPGGVMEECASDENPNVREAAA